MFLLSFSLCFSQVTFYKISCFFCFQKCFSRTTGNGLEYDELGLAGLLACRGLCALISLARCYLRTILMIFSFVYFFYAFLSVFTLKSDFLHDFLGFLKVVLVELLAKN